MGIVIPFPAPVSADLRFGGCPECGGTDGYFNIAADHFFCCDEHNVAWSVGSNLFSCWREETIEVWKENERKLSSMRLVSPIYQPPGDAA
jgi:hypothetical protein